MKVGKILLILLLLFVSCTEKPTPKARGFFRIAFPEKEYKIAKQKDLYSFEMPVYASLKDDDSAKYVWKDIYLKRQKQEDSIKSLLQKEGKRAKNLKKDTSLKILKGDYTNSLLQDNSLNYSWQNINFPQQNGQLHLSYFPIKNNLAAYIEDTHKFVYKHTIKADGIRMKEYAAPQRKVYGVLYDIEGNTASSIQFYLTDSTKHFLRGALYLNERPHKDSLDVVIDFLKEDVVRIMQTLEWK